MTSTLDSFPPPTTEPVAEPAPEPTWVPPPPTRPRRRHSAGHIVAVVLGALVTLPGLGLLAGGTALAVAQAAATDDGYFTFTPDRVASDGVAVISDDDWLDGDDGGPWVLDFLDLEIRIRADGAGPSDEVFVGIAHTDDVEDYLAGAPYAIVDELDRRDVRYDHVVGDAAVADPSDVDIWAASSSGTGEQELTWDVRGGRWSVVVMNADGRPELAADVEIGVRSDAVTPVAVVMIVFGGVTVLTGVGLIVLGVRGRRSDT